MSSTAQLRCLSLLLVGSILVFATGCGVGSYEVKMANEKARLKNFDDEFEVLGYPIEEPRKDKPENKELAASATDDTPAIFFRPPKGIKRAGNNDKKHDPSHGELFFIYPTESSVCPFAEVLVAVYLDPKNEISKDLLRQLPSLQGLPSKTRKVEPFGRPIVSFEERATADMFFFFLQKEDKRVAIIFRLEKGKPISASDKSVEMSLRSLAIGGDAGAPAREFNLQAAAKGTVISPSSAN